MSASASSRHLLPVTALFAIRTLMGHPNIDGPSPICKHTATKGNSIPRIQSYVQVNLPIRYILITPVKGKIAGLQLLGSTTDQHTKVKDPSTEKPFPAVTTCTRQMADSSKAHAPHGGSRRRERVLARSTCQL